jgi:dienelactone hydrolase
MADPTSFLSNGTSIPVQVSRPSGKGLGAVVIAYGSDGFLNTSNGPWKTMIEGYAKGLVDAGFVAVVPDYFVRTGTKPPIDITSPVGLETIATNRNKWQAALEDSIKFTKTLSDVDQSRIGLLGFSLGGHLSLRLRKIPKVLVEYFAPELSALGGVGTGGPSGLKVLIHHGDQDKIDNPGPIKKTLEDGGAKVTLVNHANAGHGFGGQYPGDAAADAKSKADTLAFLKSHL